MTYAEKLKDPRWQKRRLEILQRDSWTCQWCADDKKTLHVHHTQYHKEPWDADDDCLITLCETCHSKEDAAFRKELEQSILTKIRRMPLNEVGCILENIDLPHSLLDGMFEGDEQTYTYTVLDGSLNVIKNHGLKRVKNG